MTDIVGSRGADTLRLEATTGGSLLLGELQTISGNRNVRLTSDGTPLLLPKLQSIQGSVAFELADGQTLSLPELELLDGAGSAASAVLQAPTGEDISAPKLTTVRRTEIKLAGTQSLNLGTLEDVDGSRVRVVDGQTFAVAATSYNSLDYFGAGDVFAAEGAGSLLDLSSVASFNMNQDFGGAPVYVIAARDAGRVDLSGLASVVGARANDFVEFRAETGGRLICRRSIPSRRTCGLWRPAGGVAVWSAQQFRRRPLSDRPGFATGVS